MEKINKQDLELVQGGKYWSHISDSPYPPQSEFPTGAEDGDTCWCGGYGHDVYYQYDAQINLWVLTRDERKDF